MVHCENNKCKYYFEDSCTYEANDYMVCIDESGKCESFEKGSFIEYREDKEWD